ncbi:MAG: FHA domain-containing protein, partial [Planctomycetaceae bacterium]
MSRENRNTGSRVSGLEIQRGRTGQPFRPLLEGRLVLGSAPECDVRLGGAGMPAVHSQVHEDGGRAWIESLSADPALLINGRECDTWVLTDGDVIVVGPFAFTWRSDGGVAESVSSLVEQPLTELLDQLDRDMTLVAESAETTRRAASTVVEAALETIYGGAGGAGGADLSSEVETGRRDEMSVKFDELTRRFAAHESAHAESVSSLLASQERLASQVEALVSRLLDERSGGSA